MKKNKPHGFISAICLIFLLFCQTVTAEVTTAEADLLLHPYMLRLQREYPMLSSNKMKCDSVVVSPQERRVDIHLPKHIEALPLREKLVEEIYDSVKSRMHAACHGYEIKLYANKYELHDLIPNIYRFDTRTDRRRLVKGKHEAVALVTNESKPYTLKKGLQNRHIALWGSHGWYYETSEKVWQWQRPRLFQVCEDTYTNSYVLPYLTPMLENAGANVLLPRERDIQLNEVVVDNDERSTFYYEERNSMSQKWEYGKRDGFADKKEVYVDGENPFIYGTYRKILTERTGDAYASWTPDIPEKGSYAVYVSYQTESNSTTDARYTVCHTGGSTHFTVNQQMGGGTWIYLGTFDFDKGVNPESGKVTLSNASARDGEVLTADAVKFGGGFSNMGKYNEADSTIESSGRARFLEGARYWLQWAGYPDSVYRNSVYRKHDGMGDYKDDYMSRGEWVNNLIGGSHRSPNTKGKNIPIDMAMGLHTDAGQVFTDSIIGTMAIYMSESNQLREYTNGQRRLAGRDLSDIVQTQVVNDLQRVFRDNWTRRKMVDASYYEARVPEVPTFLLELLSHQNFTDMRYGLDPNFRFTVARAIYKGILRFLAYQNKCDYAVQPLPVKQFSAEFVGKSMDKVYLSWCEQGDSLEVTANAQRYVLYTSKNDGGWDNGRVVEKPYYIMPIDSGIIYNFKVTALNEGGESFPSEVLSVCHTPNSKECVLIINGFHRVSAPDYFETDYFSGFNDQYDRGVPDHYDISYTGSQYRFNKQAKFKNNKLPGHGTSYADFENDVIAGNTFDFPRVHGKSIVKAGYSFVSCSDDAVYKGAYNIFSFPIIDYILGCEKSTISGSKIRYSIFPEKMRTELTAFVHRRKCLFLSGAYVASDIVERDSCDAGLVNFMEHTLRYKLKESRVKTKGVLSDYFNIYKEFQTPYFHFCNLLNKHQYAVETPDAIDSVNGSNIVFSYEGNNLPAAVAYRGGYKTFISAIPFEAIESEEERDLLMSEILRFFED